MIAFMLVAGLDVRIRSSAAAAVLIGFISLTVVVKQVALTVLWRSFDPLIDKLAGSFQQIPVGGILMQAECQPEATQIAAVYSKRRPSMGHLAAMAAFNDQRFVATNFAIVGQQPVRINSAYEPYYDLQVSFGPSTCDTAEYRSELHAIEEFSRSGKSPGKSRAADLFPVNSPTEAGNTRRRGALGGLRSRI